MNTVISLIALTALRMAKNVRLEKRYNLPPLAEDIRANGLKTPITVYESKKDAFEILQGHRRFRAISLISETDPARFQELFGHGISCIVRVIDDPRDIAKYKVDHGNELSLTDPFELQMCASMLLNAGCGEKDVVIELAGLMDRINPMKAERRKEIDGLATATERDKAVFDYRRGLVQNLHNAHRAPNIVMAALEHKATGEDVEGFEGEYLPKLTTAQVTKLWKAHQKDLEIKDEKGKQVFSRRRSGPSFKDSWQKTVESSQKAEENKENGVVRDKAMSGKDMKAEVTEGKWLSHFGHQITKSHSGDKTVGDLTPLDYTCYQAELVKESDPKLWKQVVKAAKAAEDKLIASAEAVEAAAE